jgi:hypothetical protein
LVRPGPPGAQLGANMPTSDEPLEPLPFPEPLPLVEPVLTPLPGPDPLLFAEPVLLPLAAPVLTPLPGAAPLLFAEPVLAEPALAPLAKAVPLVPALAGFPVLPPWVPLAAPQSQGPKPAPEARHTCAPRHAPAPTQICVAPGTQAEAVACERVEPEHDAQSSTKARGRPTLICITGSLRS